VGVVVLAGLSLTLLLAAAALWLYAQHLYTAEGPLSDDGSERIVIIEPGSSVPRIADRLQTAGVISDARVFRAAVRVMDVAGDLKAGEYAFPSGGSLRDVIVRLEEGKVIQHSVTVPEGLTTDMILRLLDEESVLEGDRPSPPPPEGGLLPDTYSVRRGETRAAVLERMASAQERLIDELWPTRQKDLPFSTPEEAIILASIVEKETGLADERPMVAGVFVNRLRKGMKLESDPTIIYGLTRGEPLGRGLRRSEIDRQNPWSTYQIFGLPPTPICNPGEDAIRAVLDPPVTDALFFVADGTGGHAFASDYAEHLRNVAAWREIEARRAAGGSREP
jgi:UPF0755 protein